jgi:hypothetical protein
MTMNFQIGLGIMMKLEMTTPSYLTKYVSNFPDGSSMAAVRAFCSPPAMAGLLVRRRCMHTAAATRGAATILVIYCPLTLLINWLLALGLPK